MPYRQTRVDEVVFQRQFEEALNMAMNHAGMNYSEALELVFTPLNNLGGTSVVEFVRRGQLAQAKRALSELIDDRKRAIGASRLTALNRAG